MSEDKQKTTRVRIAVDVNAKGEYHALGWIGATDDPSGLNDELAEWEFYDYVAKVHRIWVEADVPLPPEEPTVEGSAKVEET